MFKMELSWPKLCLKFNHPVILVKQNCLLAVKECNKAFAFGVNRGQNIIDCHSDAKAASTILRLL